MKCVAASLAVAALLGVSAETRAVAAAETTVGGTVRDLRGAPLAGAVVELLAPNAAVVASAVTDEKGRYLFRALLPGTYQVRASVAAWLPALRSDLNLRAGSRAMADLTLAALFQAGTWLPTEHRPVTEPSDDWRWTLRSTANRPLLRFGPEDAQNKAQDISSSSSERQTRSSTRGQIRLVAGDGSFGEGGTHQIFVYDRDAGDGGGSVLRANFGTQATPAGNSSVRVDAGLQRSSPFGGGTRVLISAASHPEVQAAGVDGVALLRSAVTEQVVLGDMVTVDAGSLLTAERIGTTALQSAPFLRIEVSPLPGVSLEYRFATDRLLQGAADLDNASLPEQILSDAGGHPVFRRGLHQELRATAHSADALVTVAVFQDRVAGASTQGTGVLGKEDVLGLPLVVDPLTGTLRLVLPGYGARGAHAGVQRRLGSAVVTSFEGDIGPAAFTRVERASLNDALEGLQTHMTAAVAGSVSVTSRRMGSRLAVSYRWQQAHTLTQVDEFDAPLQHAYLGLQFRQKLWRVGRAKRVSGFVSASNLLAEGYTPVLGREGQVLFLSQAPRSLQAGLAFTF